MARPKRQFSDDISGVDQLMGALSAFLVFGPIIWVIVVLVDIVIYGLSYGR